MLEFVRKFGMEIAKALDTLTIPVVVSGCFDKMRREGRSGEESEVSETEEMSRVVRNLRVGGGLKKQKHLSGAVKAEMVQVSTYARGPILF